MKVRLEAVKLTTGPMPVPPRVTICGLPAALSVMVTEALRLPTALGVNVTETTQLPPAATELPQVLFWEKSPLFAPVTAILVMDKLKLPVLVRVTDCDTLVVSNP